MHTDSANTSTARLQLLSAMKRQCEENAMQMNLSSSQKLAQDSADALAVMKATDTGHALEDVRVYFSQLKEHRQVQSGPPAPLKPKKMG